MLREMLTYRASLPRGLGAVRRARRALIDFAAQCGFDNGVLADVESAAGEALANAVEHGDCAEGVDVMATFDGVRLVIEVKDHGIGFDCGPALERANAPDTSGNRGFGIFLMRTLMDEVAYSDCGSRIQLVKRLGARASVAAL
jgi:anti-sigma regulatory factor (Ser/Thr protein kinase)